MAEFGISGVWKDNNGVINAYAFHEIEDNKPSLAKRLTKPEAIKRLETIGNTAITMIWDYTASYWKRGAEVEVVNSVNGKYLRSKHDNKIIDNLSHLIDYDWITRSL